MITVRKALPSEIGDIKHVLRNAILKEGWSPSVEKDVMVVDQDGYIVGAGGVKIKGDEAEIIFIAVLADYRRTGFGDCLVRALINYSDRRGVKHLYVGSKKNPDFFNRIGFKPCTERDSVLVLDIEEFFNDSHCHH